MAFDRRKFLENGAKVAGLLSFGRMNWPSWMPRLAFAAPGFETSGDILVCIFLRGGVDGMNVVVPHGESYYYAARPTIAIPEPKPNDTGAAVDLNGFFGLHPALLPLRDVYQAGALAVVHAAGSPDPTHSHFDAMDYMERGTPGEKQIPTGWLGRHLQSVASKNNSPFRAVGMGSILQTALRGPIPAVALQSIADFHLKGNTREIAKVQAALASLYADNGDFVDQQGTVAFDAFELLEKANPLQYQPAHGATYPTSSYGMALRQVAQLIKADVGLEVACVDIGGWDTHVDQGGPQGELSTLLTDLGNGLAAFYTDLQEYMDHTAVVTMSEFGRRLQENGGGGTDHGHGNFMFVMGGGIAGGRIYTDWPGLAPNQLSGPGDLAITTDFRDVLGEIVKYRLKNDNLATVFPNYSTYNFRGITKSTIEVIPGVVFKGVAAS
ncbi:MAG: DUF1501 domain-containing protein [Chloroflexi bacterium]|nr:DUF1501 domain-containing protein [Chloroflexota bacterium]